MTIELIIDKNCISFKIMTEIEKRLSKELDVKIKRVSPAKISGSLKQLPITIIPAWVVDGELLHIHPMNYHALKENIQRKLSSPI
ncbi:MAG: hypothetical protein GXO74_06740 [Calditrichaeota bacterium]|nr:hypothetical protein [Calditrichota bacterium]